MLLNFNVKDQSNAIVKVNEDLHRISNNYWTLRNKLLINPEKTKIVLFGSKAIISKVEAFCLTLLEKEICPVSSAKDLGVLIDSRSLTFNDHVASTMSSLCMSRLGQINQVKHAFDRKTLITIMDASVFSKLHYCSNVWSNITESNLNKI